MTVKKTVPVKFQLIDFIVVILWCALSLWITVGFFYPDNDLFFRFGEKFTLILWVSRIGLILFFTGVLVIFFLLKTGRLKASNVALLAGSIVLCMLILLPVGNAIYVLKGIKKTVASYHPYLQLKPPIPIGLPAEKLDTDTITVFCLGGSTTEWTVANGIGWVTLAEEQLQIQTGNSKIKLYNFGRQWYTTLHTFINYQTNLRQLKPDVIIVMHAINDLLHNADQSYFSHGTFRNDYGHFYGPVNRIIENKGFIKEVAGTFRIWYQKPRAILEIVDFPGIIPFGQNLNALIDLASIDSVTVILMTQPTLLKQEMPEKEQKKLRMVNGETCGPETKWSYQSAFRGMGAYNEKTRAIAAKRQTFLIDLEKAVPKNLTYFSDEVHYRKAAHTIIGDIVSQQIIQQNILNLHIKKSALTTTDN